MPYPTIIFSSIAQWEAYVNANIITNGAELITGVIGNNAYNGAVKFVKQSPLNWSKVAMYPSGGTISLANNFLGTALFMTTTPTSLTWGDNFYNEYVLINMTSNDIPLAGSLVYYGLSGQAIDYIPANSAVNIFKASNDLWIQGNITNGTGDAQKEPKTFIVGTTTGAPTVGASTWNNPDFAGSYVVLFIGTILVDMSNSGDGTPYISKTLSSSTATINNYPTGWNTGDKLQYILITP